MIQQIPLAVNLEAVTEHPSMKALHSTGACWSLLNTVPAELQKRRYTSKTYPKRHSLLDVFYTGQLIWCPETEVLKRSEGTKYSVRQQAGYL
jgi:hypothetical protein